MCNCSHQRAARFTRARLNDPLAWTLLALTLAGSAQLLAGEIDPPTPPVVIRGPYLQLTTPTSIVLRWRTDEPSSSQVLYGTVQGQPRFSQQSPALVTDHEMRLANLSPGTRYYYSVGTADLQLAGPGSSYYFVTHPLPGAPKPLHIWVIGDAGMADTNQLAVRDAFYAANATNHVDALLQLGDNAYWTGTDAEFQAAVFNMYGGLLRHTETWPTLGNHDVYSADTNGMFAYLDIFTLPTQGEAGGVPSGTERYYSYDIGPSHFVCLDSVTSSRAPDGPMAAWLKADLAANTNRWLIAYWHYPPYSKGAHDSDLDPLMTEMRQNIVPILEAGGADLVLCGHSHSYERSYLLDGHYGFSTNLEPAMVRDGAGGQETNGVGAYLKPEPSSGPPIAHGGTVYATVGCSGLLSPGPLNHPAMFRSLYQLGSLVLDLTSNRLDAVFLAATGETNDWFTLVKTNFAPVASNLTFAVNADSPTALQLAGGDPNRDQFTFAAWTRPTNGLLSDLDPATGVATYRPARGGASTDTFSFVCNDGRLTGAPGLVTICLVPPSDANHNGLADAWETMYGLSDPNEDADGDGATNLQEYWAGTNPTNSLSWLRMTQILPGQAAMEVRWSAVGGTRYRLLYSDANGPGSFNGAFNPVIRRVEEEMDADPDGVPGTMRFIDDGSLTGGLPTNGVRFYRVQVVR